MIGHRSVTVRRYERDRYGDRVEVATFTVSGCAISPRPGQRIQGQERNVRSDTVDIEAELFVSDPDADIRPVDVIELDGKRWEVMGDPEVWDSPFEWRPGLVAALHHTRG